MVVVSHDLNLASLYCERLVLLGEGKVLADGTPEDVLNSPVLEETYGVNMNVTAGPSGRPFVIPETKTSAKGD